MKIALAQLNPTVGDIQTNLEAILAVIHEAKVAETDLVVTPELSLCGYPPRDLLLKQAKHLACEAALQCVAEAAQGIAVLVGLPTSSGRSHGRGLYNSMALCADGKVQKVISKRLLPTYDVFDEDRYFDAAEKQPIVTVMDRKGEKHKIGVTICEDIWNEPELFAPQRYGQDPVGDLAAAGAELIINASASPFTLGKPAFRQTLLQRVASRAKVPVVYVNQVGGNDELVFDGRSRVVDPVGRTRIAAKAFSEDTVYFDTRAEPQDVPLPGSDMLDLYNALVLGLQDYIRKCGFAKGIVLGLSGGIDSALTAAIAAGAFGKDSAREMILGVGMPSRYSSDHSVSDARDLAERLDLSFDVIPIKAAHDAFETMLAKQFAGMDACVAEENIQARSRGVVMMALSNKFGKLLVTTGNKSELAVGYCTLYGDMCGGFSVLSDVPKTVVFELSRWINTHPDSPLLQMYGKPVIPENTIEKPPSAELRPDQLDQDSLPSYEVLDEIIERYVEQHQPVADLIAETGFEDEMVHRMVRLIDLSEYKRRQAAPGLKVTSLAFGTGRRMPIAQRFRG